MSESKAPRHPLFDPASTYSRMRHSVRPEYKMRGYFHWQKARAIRLGIPLPESRSEGWERQKRLDEFACRIARTFSPERAPDFRVTDVMDVEPVYLHRESGFREKGYGAIVLVREADGTQTVGMWVPLDFTTLLDALEGYKQPISCRAFLIEPEVLARLEDVVQKECEVGPDNALYHAFRGETVVSHREIARLLAAIPDLDGEVRDNKIHFHRLPIASEFTTFPPRQEPLTVGLVFDDPAEIASIA